MRHLSSTIFATFLVVGTLAAQPLKYTIRVEPKGDNATKLVVDLEFYHGGQDTIYFPITSRINQVTGLYRCYRNVRGTGVRLLNGSADSTFFVFKRTDKTLPTAQLHYEIVQNNPGEAVTSTNSPAPILRNDYVHVRGYTLFLRPANYENFDVTVEWKDLPRGWAIQNSFSSGSTTQHFQLNSDEWRNSNWVAGDFRTYRGQVFGKPVCFALRGQWIFADTTLFNVILRTVETQRALWDDRDVPFYSVTLIPYVMPARPKESDSQSLCLGNGLYQSFVTYADPECLLAPFTDLFNHEMMHDWIGNKIDEGKPERPGEPVLRWFKEGFTEYYGLRNRWKAGFLDDAAFLRELNEDFLAAHYRSPYAQLSDREADRRMWESHELFQVPYRRGCVLALYLDCAIRQRTGNRETLFDTMRDLLDQFYGTGRSLNTSYDRFLAILEEHCGADVEPLLKRHIEQGQLIPANQFRVPDFLEVRTNAQGVPSLGFKTGVKDAAAQFKKD